MFLALARACPAAREFSTWVVPGRLCSESFTTEGAVPICLTAPHCEAATAMRKRTTTACCCHADDDMHAILVAHPPHSPILSSRRSSSQNTTAMLENKQAFQTKRERLQRECSCDSKGNKNTKTTTHKHTQQKAAKGKRLELGS